MSSKEHIRLGESTSFWAFIWHNNQNRKNLYWATGLSVGLFIIFKILYPYPDFISDSPYYISAAIANYDISAWPIGYSKFLRLFHFITDSDIALIGFQFLFLQISSVLFYYTILYFLNPGSITKKVIFLFIFINPLSLYLCNTINSDAIFAAFSLLWFSQLIWLLYRPHYYSLLVQAILLFLCLTIRNNAYYYPFISILAISLSGQTWKFRISGILLPLLFIVPFILHTQNEAYRLTGTHQLSLFTGWQLANNALYIYDRIEVDSNQLPTQESKDLHRLALSFIKKYNSEDYRPNLTSYVGNYFIRENAAPLKQYCSLYFTKPKNYLQIISVWGKASSVFEPFGKYIILNYPYAYARYFMCPNIIHYFLPPLSHIGLYNSGKKQVDNVEQKWFHYAKAEVYCISNTLQEMLIIYTALFLLFNVYFLTRLVLYIKRNTVFRSQEKVNKSLGVAALFILLNFGFSIFTTVNILRYQVFPMLVLLVFGLLLNDYIADPNEIKNKITSPKLSKYLSLPRKLNS